jgi:hypothetical protein
MEKIFYNIYLILPANIKNFDINFTFVSWQQSLYEISRNFSAKFREIIMGNFWTGRHENIEKRLRYFGL